MFGFCNTRKVEKEVDRLNEYIQILELEEISKKL